MISNANSRVLSVYLSRFFAPAFLLVLLGATQNASAQPAQSVDAPPAQQPAQAPVKKDPAGSVTDAAAAKTNSPKPHRVFTNDDFSSSSSVPIAPGARRRLKQLNRCDRTCFNEVKKQAIQFGYITVFPRSTREEMDDRLANDIEELHSDPKWQRLLLEMISADLDFCAMQQKTPAPQEDTPPHTPTRREILEEEERAKNPRQVPASNRNSASSAVINYRFKLNPDPLKASLMVHQYMDQLHQDCPPAPSTSDTDETEDP
jgi:hypothetical protein